MARRNITPALADVTQDIAGSIPVNLINNWLYSPKDKKSHDEMIRPYKVYGTVVSTDSSGLSRLSATKTLFEVIKLISYPKQLVFNNGSVIGGSAIGVWAADNTQMFYPKDVNINQIISQMSHVFKLLQNYDLKIGMAIHSGEFINIGGGLYGVDADYVEELAESYAEGGQMLITSSIVSDPRFKFKDKASLKEAGLGSYVFDYSGMVDFKQSQNDKYYPIPFSGEFYKDLNVSNDLKTLEKKYLSERIVILVKVFHKKQKYLLDQLTLWTQVNVLINEILKKHKVFKVKSNGSLGIFLDDKSGEGIAFAKDLKQNFEKNNFISNIGISKGQILLCNLDEDSWDIAGEAVNIASKIAEDSEEKNKILIEESVKITEGKKFKFEISGVEIKGVIV